MRRRYKLFTHLSIDHVQFLIGDKGESSVSTRLVRTLSAFVVLSVAIMFGGMACGGSDTASTSGEIALKDGPLGQPGSRFDDPDVEISLMAETFQWEIYEGEFVEVWGFNGQYPGPEIRAKEGEKVRVTVTNSLPEATAIHWHGLEVPNDQDGVPNITQPAIQPGEVWTYEFVAPKPGTTMYHTHANTVKQLPKGMFGSFIVEPREGMPEYDRQYTLMLHEIEGLYTVNGHAFPKTLEESLLKIKTGEKILIRMVNAGQQHHPMHLHGHQFKVVQLDGSPLANPLMVNTQDLAPGQTVDVEVEGTNPGTWVFHCHIIPHVTNRGAYPGGMIVALDYEDHTSYFESNPQLPPTSTPEVNETIGDHETPIAGPVETGPSVEGTAEVSVNTFDLGYDNKEIDLEVDQWINVVLKNEGALEHDLLIEGSGFRLHVPAIGSTDAAALRITERGTYTFYCSIPGHRGAGMEGIIRVE